MDVSILDAAGSALTLLLDPFRLLMLCSGVLVGLFLGIVPGIGGLAGMALLLPFTYTMDAYAAFALILGMAAVTNTSDTIPAVLFGVPGGGGASATVLDGNPMAKKGEAGRALSAAYTSSLIGGLMGAVLLGLAIPVLRPLMQHLGSPELLAFSIFGISMVAALSGSAPIRGLIVAGLGIMLSMIGADPQTATTRWTMDNLYLWDGLPIVPLVLGLFALPELADLAIKRQAISTNSNFDARKGMLTGFRDAIENWWLVVRCGGLGAIVGAIPGLGSSVVDWLAYGYAAQTIKGSEKTFGKGDVRGVIAPESANNAITAGALVPTIAFGVPGSASMSILLGVFMIHGLTPGPDMLGVNLSVTYSMVWSVALANILGAGICIAFSGQLAKIALLRHTIILPVVITFIYLGSFQASRDWGDFYTLLIFAVVGWLMKQMKWSRPPLVLGFVLGELIERYLFISYNNYEFGWITRPIVLVTIAFSALVLAAPLLRNLKAAGGLRRITSSARAPKFKPSDLFYVFLFCLVGFMIITSWNWPWGAKVAPQAVGIGILVLCVIGIVNQTFSRAFQVEQALLAGGKMAAPGFHMDNTAEYGDQSMRTILTRAAIFSGYLIVFVALVATVGFLPTIPVFVALYMRAEGRERWKLIIGMAVALTAAVYLVFDQLLHLPWPTTLVGAWFPMLTAIPSI